MQIQKFALASLLAACGGEISTLWQLLTVVTTALKLQILNLPPLDFNESSK